LTDTQREFPPYV